MPFVLRPKEERDIEVIDDKDMDWLLEARHHNY